MKSWECLKIISNTADITMNYIHNIFINQEMNVNQVEKIAASNQDNSILLTNSDNFQFPVMNNNSYTSRLSNTQPLKKRKTSISSTTSSTSNDVSSIDNKSSLSTNLQSQQSLKTTLNTCKANSNPKHLKRRRKYQKRKNSANTNPAQTQMEFNFPVWTFHLE